MFTARCSQVKPKGPYAGIRSFLFKAAVVAGALAVALRFSPWKLGAK
jgi:hypothetical protein